MLMCGCKKITSTVSSETSVITDAVQDVTLIRAVTQDNGHLMIRHIVFGL